MTYIKNIIDNGKDTKITLDGKTIIAKFLPDNGGDLVFQADNKIWYQMVSDHNSNNFPLVYKSITSSQAAAIDKANS